MEDIYTLLGLRGRDLAGTDANMLLSALTPPSYGIDNYEAYEFIGDSVLSLVVSNIIYNMGVRSPDIMTKVRSLVTKNSTLACMVTSIGLDKRVLGNGKLTEKGKADIFESIIGAVYVWASENLANPILSISRWLVEHWNIAVIISNILRGYEMSYSNGDVKMENGISDNVPLLSFMKPGDFGILTVPDAKKQLLREIDLAISIKPNAETDLNKIRLSIIEDESPSVSSLKKLKVRIYSIAMKS